MTTAADATLFTEPNPRAANIEWTPDLIRAAEIQASGGNLTLAADLVTFCRGDTKVQGDLRTRTRVLLGLPLTFEPGKGRKRKSSRVIKALEAEEDWWAALPEEQQSEVLIWGALLGVALVQNVWERDAKTGRVIPKARVWNPRWLRRDGDRWLLRVADGPFSTKEIEITPNDGTWWIYAPEGGNQPWMNGAWRAIARWVLLKLYALVDWGTYSGVKGGGVFLAKSPEKAEKSHRQALVDDLENVGRKAAIGLPHGWDVELLESTADSSRTFERQTETADRQIGYGLLGHNQTSEEGGSFAKAQSLDGVRVAILQSDATGFSTAVHDGLLVFWAEFNFGSADAAPWPHIEAAIPEDIKATAEAMSAALDASAKAMTQGIPVDREELARIYQIPVVEGAEFTDPQPPPAAPGQGDDEDEEEDDAPAPKKKPAAKAFITRAAKEGVSTAGRDDGQRYADNVGTEVRELVADEFRGDVAALRRLVAGAKDYKDLRARVVEFYEGLDPKTVARIAEKALILSKLGGHLSVLEDV